MRRLARVLVQRLANDALDLLIRDRAPDRTAAVHRLFSSIANLIGS